MTSVQMQPALQPPAPDPAAEPPRSREEAALPSVVAVEKGEPKEQPLKPPVGEAAAQQPGAQAMRIAVQKAAEQIDRKLSEAAKDVRISVDDALDRPVVRLVDANSGELVRQIPSEEALRIARRIDADTGFLLDDKA